MTGFIEKTMLIFEKQVEENKTLKEEAETIFQMGKVMQLESKEFLKLNKAKGTVGPENVMRGGIWVIENVEGKSELIEAQVQSTPIIEQQKRVCLKDVEA